MCPNPQSQTTERIERLDIVLGIGLFLGSLFAWNRWWRWGQDQIDLQVPVLWTLSLLLIIVLFRRRKVAFQGCLGVWFFYGLKGVILDQELRILPVVVIAVVLMVVLEAVMPSKPSEES